MFVHTPEHINAHFLICFISLTMIRLIQHKILIYQGKKTDSTERVANVNASVHMQLTPINEWESGLSAARIQSALREWKADPLPGGFFRMTKPSDDLLLIFNALNITCDFSIATASQLHQLKYAFDKAILM